MSDVHNHDLKNMLAEQNIELTEAVMYRTVSNKFSDKENFDYDMIIFFSPSGVDFKENYPDFKQDKIKIGTLVIVQLKLLKMLVYA